MNQDQGIRTISDLTTCRNITVLYLYNNQITTIEARPVLTLLFIPRGQLRKDLEVSKLF
jgi:hypothetical protein